MLTLFAPTSTQPNPPNGPANRCDDATHSADDADEITDVECGHPRTFVGPTIASVNLRMSGVNFVLHAARSRILPAVTMTDETVRPDGRVTPLPT
jgi:hypothetical protein